MLIVQRYKTGGDWLPDLCPSYITKVGHLFLFLSHQRPFDTQNTFHLQFDEYLYILVCPVDQDTGCNEDHIYFFKAWSMRTFVNVHTGVVSGIKHLV